MIKELPKNYNAKDSEKKWQDFWEKEGIYKFDKNSKSPVFSIDTPPPYISSDSLHTGHAMSYTQAEIIVRYHRMKGENIFYPMGFDDNGLPTERFVEKKYKVDKSKITRQEFVELCLKETREGGKKYEELWRRLGLSVDWSLLYSTISPLAQKISQRSFLDLYQKGRIYRADRPTLWCTTCQTALAQADLEAEEKDSQLVYIKALAETGEELVFATTRPELLPACMGISVHPEDKRYNHLIGKKIKMPLTKAEIILTADEATDMDFGSGVVYYCSFGGNECIEWLSRHPEAKPIKLLLPNGRFSELAGKYEGKKSLEVRKEIIEDLKESGALVKLEPTKHAVFVHERCKTDVEYIRTKQWFVKIIDLKKELKKRGEELNWYPKFMKAHLDNWIDGLKWDWCISRDRFYGVPFPLWHCQDCGEIILAKNSELPVDPKENLPKNPTCPKCQSRNIKGEMQVMDTWMTSSTTPLINNHWKENDERNIYPMSVRVQGFEIIRTWLFYTLVKAHLNTDSIPWKDVMISGWGLAKNGEKMSKSLNNFVTTESMLEKYGADALRFWSCGATLGMNLRFSEDDMRAGQKLLTKLWNATRFVMMNLEDYNQNTELSEKDLEESDRWILAEFQELIENVTNQFENYEFFKARNLLEHFFWIKFADNYIELVKGRLYGENPDKKLSAQFSLYQIISNLIKLFAPILPHISEEIYQQFFKSATSIHLEQWPATNSELKAESVSENGKKLLEIIAEIRKLKAEKGLKLSESFKQLAIESDSDFAEKIKGDLRNLSHAEKIEFTKSKKLKIEIKK
ncbi:MAG: valine--tRNA ligase [Parcubacteria group bacterium]|jgi:valyl-tRNA synthetase